MVAERAKHGQSGAALTGGPYACSDAPQNHAWAREEPPDSGQY